MYIIGVKLVLSKQSRLPGRLLFSELVETGKLQTGSKSREKICYTAKNTNFTQATKASIMQNSYRGDTLEHIRRIPTAKLKIQGKAFLKSDSRTSVTLKL